MRAWQEKVMRRALIIICAVAAPLPGVLAFSGPQVQAAYVFVLGWLLFLFVLLFLICLALDKP